MDGEICYDDPTINVKHNYIVNIFNVIYEQVINSLNERFSGHEKLFKAISIINPH